MGRVFSVRVDQAVGAMQSIKRLFKSVLKPLYGGAELVRLGFQVAAGATLVQELLEYEVASLLTVNNYFGVLQAVLNDLGIGPCFN